MVLCCDPLAIALTAAASAQQSTTSKTHLVRGTFDSWRTDPIEGHSGLGATTGLKQVAPARGSLREWFGKFAGALDSAATKLGRLAGRVC
jgi:hypothetical protein